MYRKATLRRMPEQTRKVGKLINAAESVVNRLKNMMPIIQSLELDSRALAHTKERGAITEERR